MIVLEHVTKRYGKLEVLSDISFSIQPNEFVCITGPSGAGKSTLMHMLMGAEEVTDGEVNVDGISLKKVPRKALQTYRRRIGIVFQDYKLLWNRTVRENIAFPLEVCGASDTIIKARTAELIEYMGLELQADTLCHALSGGEKARTAIARAIVHKPMIILADEPTGNLDPRESLKIMKLFKSIHSNGATVVLATHDTLLVNALKTRVIRLEAQNIVRDSVGAYDDNKKADEDEPQEDDDRHEDASSEDENEEDDDDKKHKKKKKKHKKKKSKKAKKKDTGDIEIEDDDE